MKKELLACFDRAIEFEYKYVVVRIDADGLEESIVIPKQSFEGKRAFYKSAYSEDLTHVMNSKVSILKFACFQDMKHWDFD